MRERVRDTECAHDKGDVKWNRKPRLSGNWDDPGHIEWPGICKCGKKVFEIYSQQPEIYDDETGEEIES